MEMCEIPLKKDFEAPVFTELNELCSKRNGGQILFATDDWFAEAENLLSDEEPIFVPEKFTDCGKWMDGWETRRKRIAGHDWCIIKLGVPGVIHGFDIDTAFFTGNYAPRFSIQAAKLTKEEEKWFPKRMCDIGKACTKDELDKISNYVNTENWTELVSITELNPGYPNTRHNYHSIDSTETWTHIRLNIYPDGGVARLRVFGEARPFWNDIKQKEIDLIAVQNGGLCIGYSNAHFGHPRNLIRPGKGVNMGDGWETARRLDRPAILKTDENGMLQIPGCEWAVFRLGHIGTVSYLNVDTTHFKGNYPDSIKIEGALMPSTREWRNSSIDKTVWKTILPTTKLLPNHVHIFSEEIVSNGAFSHVRVTIAPDGGISRLRVFGKASEPINIF